MPPDGAFTTARGVRTSRPHGGAGGADVASARRAGGPHFPCDGKGLDMALPIGSDIRMSKVSRLVRERQIGSPRHTLTASYQGSSSPFKPLPSHY